MEPEVPLHMDEKTYFKEPFDEQINWYGKKSTFDFSSEAKKHLYHRTNIPKGNPQRLTGQVLSYIKLKDTVNRLMPYERTS